MCQLQSLMHRNQIKKDNKRVGIFVKQRILLVALSIFYNWDLSVMQRRRGRNVAFGGINN